MVSGIEVLKLSVGSHKKCRYIKPNTVIGERMLYIEIYVKAVRRGEGAGSEKYTYSHFA
jgi:hypothetical protein